MAKTKTKYYKDRIADLKAQAKKAKVEPKSYTIKVTVKRANLKTLDTFVKKLESNAVKSKDRFIEEVIPAKMQEQLYFAKIKRIDTLYRRNLSWRKRKTVLMTTGKKESYHPACEVCPTCGFIKIIFKFHVCRQCYNKILQKTNDAKKKAGIKYKGRPAKRRVTGERQLFKRIWEERSEAHFCETCGVGIMNFNIVHFHHILHKSLRPDLRLDSGNIKILCFDCHHKEHS